MPNFLPSTTVENTIYDTHYYLKNGRSRNPLFIISSTTRSFYILPFPLSTNVSRMFALPCLIYPSSGRIPFLPNLAQNSEKIALKRLVNIWWIFSLLFFLFFLPNIDCVSFWKSSSSTISCFFSFLFCQSRSLRCISILLVVCGTHQLKRDGVFLLMKQKEVGYWIWMEVQPLRS